MHINQNPPSKTELSEYHDEILQFELQRELKKELKAKKEQEESLRRELDDMKKEDLQGDELANSKERQDGGVTEEIAVKKPVFCAHGGVSSEAPVAAQEFSTKKRPKNSPRGWDPIHGVVLPAPTLQSQNELMEKDRQKQRMKLLAMQKSDLANGKVGSSASGSG